jgi:hypothetical protein
MSKLPSDGNKDLEYSDLNETQQSRVDEASEALGGGKRRSSRQPKRKQSTRNLRYDPALSAYIASDGTMYVSSGEGDGVLKRVDRLRGEQREMLQKGGGPSRWRQVRERYGIESGGR